MLSRRSFFRLAGSGLLVAATERVRAYSFVGGWETRAFTSYDDEGFLPEPTNVTRLVIKALHERIREQAFAFGLTDSDLLSVRDSILSLTPALRSP